MTPTGPSHTDYLIKYWRTPVQVEPLPSLSNTSEASETEQLTFEELELRTFSRMPAPTGESCVCVCVLPACLLIFLLVCVCVCVTVSNSS